MSLRSILCGVSKDEIECTSKYCVFCHQVASETFHMPYVFLPCFPDIETGAMEEKNKRDHYTQLVGACLVRVSFRKAGYVFFSC